MKQEPKTKTTTHANRKSSRTTRSSVSRKQTRKKNGILRTLWQLFTLTFFGRVLTAILALSLMITIDLYAVSFRYDLFFTVLGIEAAIAGILLWIRFLVRTRPEKTG